MQAIAGWQSQRIKTCDRVALIQLASYDRPQCLRNPSGRLAVDTVPDVLLPTPAGPTLQSHIAELCSTSIRRNSPFGTRLGDCDEAFAVCADVLRGFGRGRCRAERETTALARRPGKAEGGARSAVCARW